MMENATMESAVPIGRIITDLRWIAGNPAQNETITPEIGMDVDVYHIRRSVDDRDDYACLPGKPWLSTRPENICGGRIVAARQKPGRSGKLYWRVDVEQTTPYGRTKTA